jgi:hypothetical protein
VAQIIKNVAKQWRIWYDTSIDKATASLVMEHPEAWPTEERVSTVDEIRISPAGDGFYAAASESIYTHAEQAERDCFFCLEGWVFLGSIDHDGWEVFEAIRCRRCGGTGRIEDR